MRFQAKYSAVFRLARNRRPASGFSREEFQPITGAHMAKISRRHFTKAAAVGMTALSAGRVAAAAGDKVRIGFIGLGNRGDQVLDAFLACKDADIVALCDIY